MQKKWSQEELAKRAEITQGSVSRIENNTQINLTEETKSSLEGDPVRSIKSYMNKF
ncbi:MAG TPA: hypothetical protein DHO02_05695 [Syntrophaceae bacterium]|nr:hypothetical protein [Syntrophaceae bacterium]HCX01876.1 hypothetical protein [Syntrophaceae bacterium]